MINNQNRKSFKIKANKRLLLQFVDLMNDKEFLTLLFSISTAINKAMCSNFWVL